MEDLKLICSLAAWRTLRSKDKTQYDVIAIFCKNIIANHYSTIPFSMQDISKKIEIEYGFNKIPNSVLEEVLSQKLNKFLKRNKDDDRFCVKEKLDADNNMTDIVKKYKEEYTKFYQDLKNFLEKQTYKYPDNFLELFNYYLLDEKLDKQRNKEVFAHFANFLLKNKKYYDDLLRTIKEGVILYEGLQYGIKRAKNNSKIILFLDTEILFHAMDYNGKMYKQKFDDFYNLVCKYDENRLLMPLFYSEMVEDEIRIFFNAAKQIKEKNTANYKPTAAMVYLMEKCKDANEVESEESNFFYQLGKKFKIQKYKESYKDMLEKYQEYNLESMYSLGNIRQDLGDSNKGKDTEEEIAGSIKALSYINMVRRDNPSNLFNSKAMLITNTNITNRIAWHEEITESKKNIPLSNHLDFIIARLWEFIETSLGNTERLVSFNPIFNLQLALKEMLQENLNKQYIRAKENYNEDKDKDRFCREILDIQDKMKLEPNIENMEIFEALFNDEIEEQRKLQTIEKEKSFKEGIALGKEQGRKEAELEAKRRQKKENYPKRLKAYKQKQCKKNIRNTKNKIMDFFKNHIWSFILGICASLIATFIWSCCYAN